MRLIIQTILVTSLLAIFTLKCAALQKDETGTEFLTIGDPAPQLDVSHWLKGSEITTFEPDQVYVIEFWATWCKYCQAAIPHLSALQDAYGKDGVTVIGISAEKLQTVFEFLAKPQWNENTQYTIATDPDRSTQKAYMQASAMGNIPVAFIVGKEGHIEWIGHPSKMSTPLSEVVLDFWDREKFKKKFEKEVKPARERALRIRDIRTAYKEKDWEETLRLFDEAIKHDPKPDILKVQKFMLMVGEMGEYEKGYNFGRKLLSELKDNALALNNLAWFVVDSDSVEVRDLDFAMHAAERANELTEFKDAAALDTLARVYFEMGDLEKAIEWQDKAVKNLKDGDPQRDGILTAMEKYLKMQGDG